MDSCEYPRKQLDVSTVNILLCYHLGETILQSGGSIGEDNDKDIRRFPVAKPPITLAYVFVTTLLSDESKEEIELLQTLSDTTSIDVVICCSCLSDMNK